MNNNEDPSKKQQIPASVQLFEYLLGFMKSQAIHVAARLKIADHLKDGPKSAEEISNAFNVDGDALYRLLRALSAIGVFSEQDNKIFSLTPMASALLSDIPGSLRPFALMIGDWSWWGSWSELFYSVKSGKPAVDHVLGMTFDEYLEKNPNTSLTLNEVMTSVSQVSNGAIVGSYDFSAFRTVVDVGGGQGSLVSAILKKNPELHGILFDLPRVVKSVGSMDAGLAGRLDIMGGDFFEKVPSGGDVYVLKQIIHDWGDEKAVRILRNCRKGIKSKGHILVIEGLIGPGPDKSITKLFDLHMLVTASGGRERTEPEYGSLFDAAGFRLSRIIPTPSSYAIIQGDPR